MRLRRGWLACALLVASPAALESPAPVRLATVAAQSVAVRRDVVRLPNRDGTFKFAVLGDFGTGDRPQYDLAAQMATLHDRFAFSIVVLVGDNLYGSERPQDFRKKFEVPYKPLLDAGVRFYASLGNHDAREQRYYKHFNMDGRLYYSFSPHPDVRFVALESTYLEPEQVRWAERELAFSGQRWKIVFFHHPLYSSGERHGSDVNLREVLEPLFLKTGVSLVLTGHDHFYERVRPQKGLTYFVVGSGGKLRRGNIDRASAISASGFDTDLAFLAAEIVGDDLYFNAISRAGAVVDSGVVRRPTAGR